MLPPCQASSTLRPGHDDRGIVSALTSPWPYKTSSSEAIIIYPGKDLKHASEVDETAMRHVQRC